MQEESSDILFEECGDLLCVLSAAGCIISDDGISAVRSEQRAGDTPPTNEKALSTSIPHRSVPTDADYTLEKVNAAFSTTLGWSKDELFGRLFHELFHTVNISKDEQCNDPKHTSSISKHLLNKRSTFDRRLRCKDGSFRWISWNVTRLSTSTNEQTMVLASGRDITDSKEDELAVRSSEQRLQDSLQIAKLGQWDLDLTTNTLLWSSEIYRLFMIDPAKFGASYEAFLNGIHPDDRDMVNSAYLGHLESKEPYEVIHRLLLPDKSIKWVLESCRSEFDSSGAPLRSIGTVQDITELKQAQEDLRMAKERAELADSLKSAFLANMSHEIRTPMNAVIGFTDLILMDGDSIAPDNREYLETINTSGKLLLTLINDILDISKIEAGQLELENKSFSLGEILKLVEYNATGLLARKDQPIKFLKPMSMNGGGKRDCVLLPGVHDTIVGDPTRLQQVLNNLLSNAIKFTSSGSVQYKVKTIVQPKGKMLEFSVSDTGVGIPEAKQQMIFEPFRQAHGRHGSHSLGGTGLGLAIARKLVEKMGGDIHLESFTEGPNQGTTFRFTIPYRPGINADENRSAATLGSSGFSLPKLRGKVLLVDDNRVNLKLIDRFVTKMGCESETAENGNIAIAKYFSDPSVFDVILMDKEMPQMDGLEAVEKIRAFEEDTKQKKRVPIVAVTAAAMVGDREECLEAGCDDYITKPLSRSELHLVLSKFLQTR